MPGHIPRTRGPIPPRWFGKSSNPPDVWADPTGAPGTATASAAGPVVEVIVSAPAGSSTASATPPTILGALIASAGLSTAQAAAPTLTAVIAAFAGSATANATAPNVGEGIVPSAGSATATGTPPAVSITTTAAPSGGGGPSLRQVAEAWQRRQTVTVNTTAGAAFVIGGTAVVSVTAPARVLRVDEDEFALVELLLAR